MPRGDCKTEAASAGRLKISAPSDPAKSKLVWLWKHGGATTPEELGDPLTSTSYRLCVYDGSGQRVIDAAVPPGGTCDGKPCWKATGKSPNGGFRYFDKSGGSAGLIDVSVSAAAEGSAKVTVKAKGAQLAVPALPLSQAPSAVVAQLVNSSTSTCWSASYSDPPAGDPTSTGKWKDAND